MSGTQRAFTLIELLVVIAIIGVLVSLLVPSLSSARVQARSALCLSNLKQLSHGWHAYADEYRDVALPGRFAKLPGVVPALCEDGFPPTAGSWYRRAISGGWGELVME